MEKKDFTILVADDDEIARDVVGSLLSREGYPVVLARDGNEAMQALQYGPIGLVITDLKMPGPDGLMVLKHAVRISPDTAVVVLTAYGTLDTTLEAMQEGAYDYLTKPFKGQEILILADRAYRRAILMHENHELRQHLRDFCGEVEQLIKLYGGVPAGARTGWLERLERLEALAVLSQEEAQRAKKRLGLH